MYNHIGNNLGINKQGEANVKNKKQNCNNIKEIRKIVKRWL